MSSWFARSEVALPGFAAHFRTESNSEREHGMKLMEYQAKRGGKVVFQNIEKPTSMEWGTPLQAFLESNYLDEQVEGIKEIGDFITKIKRAGDGLGTLRRACHTGGCQQKICSNQFRGDQGRKKTGKRCCLRMRLHLSLQASPFSRCLMSGRPAGLSFPKPSRTCSTPNKCLSQ